MPQLLFTIRTRFSPVQRSSVLPKRKEAQLEPLLGEQHMALWHNSSAFLTSRGNAVRSIVQSVGMST
jgi:hypothetical protein